MKKQYTHCIIANSLPGLGFDPNDDNYIDDPEEME